MFIKSRIFLQIISFLYISFSFFLPFLLIHFPNFFFLFFDYHYEAGHHQNLTFNKKLTLPSYKIYKIKNHLYHNNKNYYLYKQKKLLSKFPINKINCCLNCIFIIFFLLPSFSSKYFFQIKFSSKSIASYFLFLKSPFHFFSFSAPVLLFSPSFSFYPPNILFFFIIFSSLILLFLFILHAGNY